MDTTTLKTEIQLDKAFFKTNSIAIALDRIINLCLSLSLSLSVTLE
jgi:hypothetical protein